MNDIQTKNMEKAGLLYWSERVIEELGLVGTTFDPDPVHDLRVALRRCRSLADGFLGVDPDRGWKQLKKVARELFRRLGSLRDMQVMEELVSHLGEPGDPVRSDLLALLASQEAQLKSNAEMAVHAFDQNRWASLTRRLAARTHGIPIEGQIFQHMATERWEQAHALHRQALRNRTQVAMHRLRIGIKKFRYTVENFLPQRHAKWGSDLKDFQDILGEIHDLDVLATILRSRSGIAVADRKRWQTRIREERAQRVEKYRARMVGRDSLWRTWRADLPKGPELEEAALARIRAWGAFLDPDIKHSQHVTQLALQLYDGLTRDELFRPSQRHRRILETAALLHDIGLAKGNHAHHKQTSRLIRKIAVPLGWTSSELRAIGAVARYHRGALPRPEHKSLTSLPGSARPSIVRLAGVLRLANAFDLEHDQKIHALHVEHTNGTIVVRGEGYNPAGPNAERIAAARHLLEATCQVAVLVRPL